MPHGSTGASHNDNPVFEHASIYQQGSVSEGMRWTVAEAFTNTANKHRLFVVVVVVVV